MRNYKLFVMNLGSTSTKVGIYENEKQIASKSIRYSREELKKYNTILDQKEMRIAGILDFLKDNNYILNDFDAIISRGPIVKPISSGVYAINEEMLADAMKYGSYHPVSLGIRIALELSNTYKIPCYTVNPPTVDELIPIARISGFANIERSSLYQPLNHKQIAKTWAKEHNTKYEDVNLIVAHMGGGTTVAAHQKGKAIDVNNGTLGEGPMTPERPGSIPLIPIIKECYSGKYTQDEMEYRVYHGGGVASYLGTTDMVEVEKRATNGDEKAKLVLDALVYQISKEIGAMHAVLKGEVNAILLTGGLAYCNYICNEIQKYVGSFAEVSVYPGEDELGALIDGTLQYLRNEIELQKY